MTTQRVKKSAGGPETREATILAFAEGLDSKETVQNRTYLALKDAIMSGRFKPGELVTLRKLSETLGTSEMPVREALKRLTAEGAFEALPNRSARIPRLTKTQILQVLDLRKLLEGRAAEYATGHMSKRQLEGLTQLQDRMESMIARADTEQFTALNKQFHFTIYRIAGNEPLLGLIEALWMRMAPLVSWTGMMAAGDAAMLRRIGGTHHRELLAAFGAHDPGAADKAMQADLHEATQIPGYWEAIEKIGTAIPGGEKFR